MRILLTRGIWALLIVLFCFTVNCVAQDLESGDVQFELQAYHLAIDSYTKALEIDPENEYILGQIAHSYEKMDDKINAARYFDKLFEINFERNDSERIAYGKILKSLGLYDQATEIFESCEGDSMKELAIQYVESCKVAKLMLNSDKTEEVQLINANSTEADFSPAIWRDQFVYASFIPKSEDLNTDAFSLIHEQKNTLFSTPMNINADFSAAQSFGSDLFDHAGISSCSFTEDGTKVAFTRNNFRNSNKHISGDEKGLSVYVASVDENGDFYNEYALPFNSTEYSVAFACFGGNEHTLYFASNMKDGHNDFDIYLSQYVGGKWDTPIKLSSEINTAGNEISPFFHNGSLYFSSDLNGLGGYDIFRADKNGLSWAQAINLGHGINSISDDLYYLIDKNNGKSFFVSNRLGGYGKYDIYTAGSAIHVNKLAAVDMEVISNSEIPIAVSLENLSETENIDVQFNDAKLVSNIENSSKSESISLVGAVKIAEGELILDKDSRVFFIQLASLSKTKGSEKLFQSLVDLGNVYRIKKNTTFKIRLGYFHNENQAEQILKEVRRKGFKDAFIVEENLDIKSLELLVSSFTFNKREKYIKPDTESEYKVRLAAYSNPLYFDTEKVKDLGVIEQWSKGDWTIFILGGYENLETAMNARIKAINRGFSGAELVLDDNGTLSRVKVN